MKFVTFIGLNGKDGPIIVRSGSIDVIESHRMFDGVSSGHTMTRVILKGSAGHSFLCHETVEEVFSKMVVMAREKAQAE